jgi:aminopeptidase N
MKMLTWFVEGVSLGDMIYLASIVTHECVHMWVGNLVTMRWWDDLWLNESFADFLSYECLTAIQDKVSSLAYGAQLPNLVFLAKSDDAYIVDQLDNGTHPLSSPMENITPARNHFDGITY